MERELLFRVAASRLPDGGAMMQPVVIEDLVLDLERWQEERGARLAAILLHRQVRRVTLGELATLEFEDRTTVAWQVNEVLRTEAITDVRRIEDELRFYNRLVPGPGQIAATMFVTWPAEAAKVEMGARLRELGASMRLTVAGRRATTVPDPEVGEGRPLVVQFLLFRLDTQQVSGFTDPAVETVVTVDHPEYPQRVVLSNAQRKAVAASIG